MDSNQGRTETPNQNEGEEQASQQAQPELQKDKAERSSANVASQQAPKLSAPKMAMPKISLPKIEFKTESLQWLSNKLKEYKRVLLITKKPDMEEFKTTVKASALGMTIIGVVGFIIAIIAQLLTT